MGKNLVRKTFEANGSWVCPAGVDRVKILCNAILRPQISTGDSTTVAVTMQGDAYSFGNSVNGQLGNGTVTPVSSPVIVIGGLKWRQVSSNQQSMLGLSTSGDAYGWGANNSGGLGTGSVTPVSSPVIVVGGLKWREVWAGGGNSGFGLGVAAATGAAYGWGSNESGQLGLGDVTPRSSPVIVLGSLLWSKISAGGGSFSLGIASTGAAYGWGVNSNGRLGVGDNTPRSSPVLVVGGLSWSQISAGGNCGLGITTTGDMYAWGNNGSGQLGNGTITSTSSPVLVLGGLKWRRCVAGTADCYGITTSGDLYAWGLNANGELGVGDQVSRSSPVLVLGSHKWRSIGTSNSRETAVGIATDGTAYGWGQNSFGEVGNGTTNNTFSSPILIVGGNLWRAVDNALVAEQIVTVIPGTTYTATIFAAIAQFGPTALYTDQSNTGSLPVDITLEYFA